MTLEPSEEPPSDPLPAVAEPSRLSTWLQSKPVFGVIMLVIGLVVGYVSRPALEARPGVSGAPASSTSSVQGPQPMPQSQEELLPYLVSQTRHWRGSADAPVALIEFADFQ